MDGRRTAVGGRAGARQVRVGGVEREALTGRLALAARAAPAYPTAMRPILLLCLVPAGLAAQPAKRQPVVLTDEARALHRDCLVVDGHNDLPWQFREKKDLSFHTLDIARPQKGIHTDLPRLREGGVGAQF